MSNREAFERAALLISMNAGLSNNVAPIVAYVAELGAENKRLREQKEWWEGAHLPLGIEIAAVKAERDAAIEKNRRLMEAAAEVARERDALKARVESAPKFWIWWWKDLAGHRFIQDIAIDRESLEDRDQQEGDWIERAYVVPVEEGEG